MILIFMAFSESTMAEIDESDFVKMNVEKDDTFSNDEDVSDGKKNGARKVIIQQSVEDEKILYLFTDRLVIVIFNVWH